MIIRQIQAVIESQLFKEKAVVIHCLLSVDRAKRVIIRERQKNFHFVQFGGVKIFHFVQFRSEKLSILCSLRKK